MGYSFVPLEHVVINLVTEETWVGIIKKSDFMWMFSLMVMTVD